MISDWAESCSDQVGRLAGRTDQFPNIDIAMAGENLFCQVKAWTCERGAFAKSHNSLDYACRDSPVAKKLALDQLERLRYNLDRGKATAEPLTILGTNDASQHYRSSAETKVPLKIVMMKRVTLESGSMNWRCRSLRRSLPRPVHLPLTRRSLAQPQNHSSRLDCSADCLSVETSSADCTDSPSSLVFHTASSTATRMLITLS